MKTRFLLSLLGAAFLAFGCSKNEPAQTTTAQAETQSGPRTIEITAGDNMKFNITSIEASPGEEIKVVLTNIGTQPKDVMGHDWVLLKGGVDAAAFDAAASQAKTEDYLPQSKMGDVIAHTKMLGPKQSDSVTFKAPMEKGDYTFMCSFPAHFQVGMHGKLTVK
ncbi:azurin [Horticoccus luteus]|uniref:Azurin n=1 Tax=Horticoccus luteus TaxID=2862869 RepID=A0A8F9TY36_9BACT|nr:plastocyanin/azurin family copper-binding protein [Horticoccus luteus]QYM79984.1 azurin [Horticoccus luteus]